MDPLPPPVFQPAADPSGAMVSAGSEASQSKKAAGSPRGAVRDACRRLQRGAGAACGPRPRAPERPAQPRPAPRGGRQRRPPGRPAPCRPHAARRGGPAATGTGSIVGSARSAYDRVPPALRLSLCRRRAGGGERRACDLPRRARPCTRLAEARGTCGVVLDRRTRPDDGRDAPARALRALPRRDRPRHPARGPGPRPRGGDGGSGPFPCRPRRARGANRARAEPGLPRRSAPARSPGRPHRARRGRAGARARAGRGSADRGRARAGDGRLARPDPDGPGPLPRFRLIYKTSNQPGRRRLAEAIQAALAEVGIALEVRTYEWGTLFADIRSGNFQLCALAWVGIGDPDLYYLAFHSTMHPPAGYNRGGYASRVMDRLTESGRREIDLERRRAIYARVQRRAARDLPVVPLWWEDRIVVRAPRLRGFEPSPDGDLHGLTRAWMEAGDTARAPNGPPEAQSFAGRGFAAVGTARARGARESATRGAGRGSGRRRGLGASEERSARSARA